MIKSFLQCRFNDTKVRRNIEITRTEKTVVANVVDLTLSVAWLCVCYLALLYVASLTGSLIAKVS